MDMETETETPATNGDEGTGKTLVVKQAQEGSISPRDVLAWKCVQEITSWMIENKSSSISAACEAMGWPRWYYYQIARENEYVQAQVANQMHAMGMAEQELLTARWLSIISAQVDIATGPDKRTAVAAARFLATRWDTLRDQLVEDEDAGSSKKSRAEQLLDQLLEKGGGTVTTTTKTVVEPSAIQVN